MTPLNTRHGLFGWMRQNLFRGLFDTMATLAMSRLVGYLALWFLNWSILSAVWEADNRRECLAKSVGGARWAGVFAW